MTIEERKNNFINKSNIKFGYNFDYSLVNYVNKRSKVKIICNEHGEFNQTPDVHLNSKHGCPTCGYVALCGNTDKFINKAKRIHDDKYNYDLVDYIDYKQKVIITCPIHGEFKQSPNDHLNGCGCYKCTSNYKSNDEFLRNAHDVHGNIYEYVDSYIDTYTKIRIICPIHGEFKQLPKIHIKGHGCPKCNNSKGEIEISKLLDINNINYDTQKLFDKCKYKRKLPFDFYLPGYNICIEFDGRQHYEPIEKWGGLKYLKDQQHRDNIKDKFCEDNSIRLIRIKYDDNILNKLNENNII